MVGGKFYMAGNFYKIPEAGWPLDRTLLTKCYYS